MMRGLLAGALVLAALAAHAQAPRPDAQAFAREVDRRLEVPAQVQAAYAKRLRVALAQAGVADAQPQYFVLIDRSARVQALFVYWRSPEGALELIGASPVSTGRPGEYEHFLTPLGVFAHSPDNMDFRAEGTRNDLGILGYGREGLRVYDFGWVAEERAWGARGLGVMRLQMHATDPDFLEPLLGTRHSKGCIRIPAGLNVFIDRHGLLDADYEGALREGRPLRVLRADREPTSTPGRWLVVIDSQRGAELEDAYDEMVAAQALLRQAEAARDAGLEPAPGERLGIGGGRSRLTPEYWERQKRLEDDVEVARRRLDAALARWNALR